MKISATKCLALESIINISFSVILHATVLILLGSSGYGNFAVGLTIVAILSASALGTSILLPNWISLHLDTERRLRDAILLQIMIGLTGALLFSLGYTVAREFFWSAIGVTIQLIFAAAVLFVSQQVDESLQMYWRLTGNEYRALKYSFSGKIFILLVLSLTVTVTHSGALIFNIFGLSASMVALFKLKMFSKTTGLAILQLPRDSITLLNAHMSVWMGNVSNMIFNGVMRMLLGQQLGKDILAMLTLASQAGAAANNFMYALSLKSIIKRTDKSYQDKTDLLLFNKNVSSARFIFGASVVLTALILWWSFFYKKSIAIDGKTAFHILIPIVLSLNLSVLSVPHFQLCQKHGKIGDISIFNFKLSIIGIMFVFAFIHLIKIDAILLWIYFGVCLSSAVYIISQSKSSGSHTVV
jgi:hypothetical protein